MKAKKIVISIFSFSLLFLRIETSYSEDKSLHLEIHPAQVFVGDEASIHFNARLIPEFNFGTLQKPRTLTLVEWNEAGTEIKYHWELNDDGKQGDEKANDGIYSRTIQFKEKKIKNISFWVTEEKLGENTNPTSVFLHKTSPQLTNPSFIPDSQKATLTILSRPTFQEILKDAYRKIVDKFKS